MIGFIFGIMSAFFAGLGADEDGVGDRGYCSGLRVGGLRVDEDEDSMASLLVSQVLT